MSPVPCCPTPPYHPTGQHFHCFSTTPLPTTATTTTSNRKQQNNTTKKILKQKVDQDLIEQALCMFHDQIETNQAHGHYLKILLSPNKSNMNSTQMKRLLDATLKTTQITPTIGTLNTYVLALMIEGNPQKAKEFVEVELPRMKVAPNQHTHDALALNENPNMLSKRRATKLKNDFKMGNGKGNKEMATNAAWELFHTLVERKLIKRVHCNVMLGEQNSDQMRTFIHTTMKQANVAPDVQSYLLYVARLMMEGKYKVAQQVVQVEVKAMNVQHNKWSNRTLLNTLDLTPSELNDRRTRKLTEYWKQGGDTATREAWALFHNLMAQNVAHADHFNAMLLFCHNSAQMLNMIEKTMVEAHVQPNASTLQIYGERLMVEGTLSCPKFSQMQDRQDRQETTQETTQETQRVADTHPTTMNTDPVHSQRETQIHQFLQLGTQGELAAEHLLLLLHQQGLTTPQLYLQVIEHFVNQSAEKEQLRLVMMRALHWYRTWLKENNALGETNDNVILDDEQLKMLTALNPDDLTLMCTDRAIEMSKIHAAGTNKHALIRLVEEHNISLSDIGTIDLTNSPQRGVAIVKVVDRLLHIRDQWTAGNIRVPDVKILVGQGIFKGAVKRLLAEQLYPPICTLENAGDSVVTTRQILVLKKGHVWKWFQSNQAQDWSEH